MEVREHSHARAHRTRLRLRFAALAACLCGLFAVQASPAQASSHDYCNWDGTTVTTLSPWALCSALAIVPLTENTAVLTSGSTDTSVYCGALLNGVQYGANNVGNPTCTHMYAGANNLVAYAYIGPNTRPVHGFIKY